MKLPIDTEQKQLMKDFGLSHTAELKGLPAFGGFQSGLLFSHRDLDLFLSKLKKGERVAIISGFNPSSKIHLGHKSFLDVHLFFQKKYGVHSFIPISDDESYVVGKVETQKEALANARHLVKELLALGFDPKKTHIYIDQIFTNIYNLAIKLSKKVTGSTIKAVYGYGDDTNSGMFFYPVVQSAHILLPLVLGYKEVLVPVGLDQDPYIRISRDLAAKFNLPKPAEVCSVLLPGIDGKKMSKSRPDSAIFLDENLASIKKKVMRAFSGGRQSLAEHRKLGGIPEQDVALQYLTAYFLSQKEADRLEKNYKKGKILSSELKEKLYKELERFLKAYKKRLARVTEKDVDKVLMRNGDYGSLA
ncbi:MAG: tryptophan--tRNA ligase [DPANN group archaeon]|nr:tryptophan--tRNA ligase [DPANN group archaeon]